MNLSLPYPPAGCTGNHATKHGRNGHYAAPEAKAYRRAIRVAAVQQGACIGLQGLLHVVVLINPPDKRRRDMDNVWKTCGDALTHAGVWEDDYQIADLRLIRGDPVAGGAVSVSVEEL